MILTLLAAAALTAAEPAAISLASPSATLPFSAPLQPGERRIKVVCRVEVRTGTRFARRVCTPIDVVRERERAVQDTINDMQRARRAL